MMDYSHLIVLKARGPRTVATAAEALADLARFAALLDDADDCPTAPVLLDISGRVWPAATLQVWRPIFERIANRLKVLHISDIIASLPTEEGLATFELLGTSFATSPLVEIILDDNAVGSRGMTKLMRLLHAPTLRRLSLRNLGLSSQDGEHMLAALQSVVGQLHALFVSRNQMGVAGARCVGRILALCHEARELEYAGCRPLRPGSLAICQGMAEAGLTHLVSLNLDDCHLGDGSDENDAVLVLVPTLQRSSNLQRLNLCNCELEDDGVRLILGDALSRPDHNDGRASPPPALHYLNIAGNNLTADAAPCIADYLSQHGDALRELDLDDNQLEDAGVTIIVPALAQCPRLVTIMLASNLLQLDGVQALLTAQQNQQLPGGGGGDVAFTVHLGANDDLEVQVAQELRDAGVGVVLDADQEDSLRAMDHDDDDDAVDGVDELADALGKM